MYKKNTVWLFFSKTIPGAFHLFLKFLHICPFKFLFSFPRKTFSVVSNGNLYPGNLRLHTSDGKEGCLIFQHMHSLGNQMCTVVRIGIPVSFHSFFHLLFVIPVCTVHWADLRHRFHKPHCRKNFCLFTPNQHIAADEDQIRPFFSNRVYKFLILFPVFLVVQVTQENDFPVFHHFRKFIRTYLISCDTKCMCLIQNP